MARKFTTKEMEFTQVLEGYTGRIIARRGLRRTLGNPKIRARELAALMFEMFQKGVEQGKKLENLRIVYATAGMTYPTVEPSALLTTSPPTIGVSVDDQVCSDPESDGPLAGSVDPGNFSDTDPRQYRCT